MECVSLRTHICVSTQVTRRMYKVSASAGTGEGEGGEEEEEEDEGVD